MREYLINKRLKELCGSKEYLDNVANKILFNEYMQDKINNVALEDSNARTLLILGNKRIISFVLKKEFAIYGDYENLEEFAVGKIGLVHAVDGYDNDSDIQFVTYAYRVIANQIKKYYRNMYAVSNYSELNKVFLEDFVCESDCDGESQRFIDIIKDENNFVEQVIDCDMVKYIEKNIAYLSHNEAVTVINFFGLFGKPVLKQSEIGAMIGVQQCTISMYLSNALKKLRALTLEESLLNESELQLKFKLLQSGPQNDIVETEVLL